MSSKKKGVQSSSSRKNYVLEKLSPVSPFYDVIIIGGGIGGLYTMYQLTKKNPELKILLLEKEKKLGGRISTYKDKNMTLEEGAGRFSDHHVLFVELLKELGLNYKIQKISANAVFMPSGGGGRVLKLGDSPKKKNPSFLEAITDPMFDYGLNLLFDESSLPCTRLIAKVVLESQFDSKEFLQGRTFLQYAEKVLDKSQVQCIWDCFGYSNELCIMNAYDCIQLMNGLSPMNSFYSLRGGLGGVIEKMVEVIQRGKCGVIMTEKEVHGIRYMGDGAGSRSGVGFLVKLRDGGGSYSCQKVVCALPKEALRNLRILDPIRKRLLDKVNSGSLCRIYSRFSKDSNGKFWFDDLPKFTTNNALRMVIPYDKDSGVIMISYSDGAFADSWWRLYKEKGVGGVDQKIQELIQKSTGILIPSPKSTKVFYWKYGVGYWGVGSDSEMVAEQIIRPFLDMDLFVCGENYSCRFQQWMEGALETSSQILEMIC
jgi:hypothetical protein